MIARWTEMGSKWRAYFAVVVHRVEVHLLADVLGE